MRSIAIILFVLSAGPALATQAEYAFRWDAAKGGPQTVDDVLVALQIPSGESQQFEVRYFDIVQKASFPKGYRAVGRERGEQGKKPDGMLKIRGPEPVAPALIGWKCPLTGKSKSKSKAEFDITVIGTGVPKRSYSVSCTAKKMSLAAALPQQLKATPVGCLNQMERVKSGGFTVELWKLASKRTVIEVSMEGVDTAADLETFRSRVVPPDRSKSSTARGRHDRARD